jgi:hypothetical protein
LKLDWDEEWWDNDYSWRNNVWYTMTATGLERTDKKSDDDDNGPADVDEDNNGGEYRYKKGEEDR